MAPSIASPHENGAPIGRRLPYGMAASVISVDAINDVRNAMFIPGHSRTSMARTSIAATPMAVMPASPLAAPVLLRSWGRVVGSVVPVHIVLVCPTVTDSWGTLA